MLTLMVPGFRCLNYRILDKNIGDMKILRFVNSLCVFGVFVVIRLLGLYISLLYLYPISPL